MDVCFGVGFGVRGFESMVTTRGFVEWGEGLKGWGMGFKVSGLG